MKKISSNDRILRKPEVGFKTGLSDPTIWRMERDGKFPKRLKMGGKSVGWLESEIIAWIQEKIRER